MMMMIMMMMMIITMVIMLTFEEGEKQVYLSESQDNEPQMVEDRKWFDSSR